MGDFVATFRTLPGHSIDADLPGFDRDARYGASRQRAA